MTRDKKKTEYPDNNHDESHEPKNHHINEPIVHRNFVDIGISRHHFVGGRFVGFLSL